MVKQAGGGGAAVIYFITYPESPGHWQQMYNNAVISELARAGHEYHKIVLDFFDPGCVDLLREIQFIRSTEQDIWLLAWAQNPVIDMIGHKPGRKFGHVHGLQCFAFDPSVLSGVDLEEANRFSHYDRIFVNSEWSLTNAIRAYPQHAAKFTVTGFPMDYEALDAFKGSPKEEALIVFNQRFALERMPTLVVELASRLRHEGYRVVQLLGERTENISKRNPDLGKLLRVGQRVGLEFVYNPSKAEYLSRLARASVVITTSLCDNLPVSMLEAIYLDVVPVAPKAMCFSEFIHSDNLYSPYCIDEILAIVRRAPVRPHRFEQYAKHRVMSAYLDAFSSPG